MNIKINKQIMLDTYMSKVKQYYIMIQLHMTVMKKMLMI